MKIIQSAVLGATVFALATGSVFAADPATQEKNPTTHEKNKRNISNATRSEDSTFAKLDKNKDGYITRAEAAADPALARDLATFDLNKDGKLNRAEYLAARAKADTGSVVNRVTGNDKEPKSGTGASTPPAR